MSLSGALNSALTGLVVSTRAAGVVSANIANALTEGYGRRELVVAAQTIGGAGAGVQAVGTFRMVDEALVGDLRLTEAALQDAGARMDFWGRLEQAFGTAEQPGSLSDRIATLEAALVSAVSQPGSDARLAAVLYASQGLTADIAGLAGGVQEARRSADRQIADDVGMVNAALEQLHTLNRQIRKLSATGNDPLALKDQRQTVLDRLGEVIPLVTTHKPDGQIALFSKGGAVLLDERPAVLGFQPANMLTAETTLASGVLSGITINGQAVPTGEGGPLSGGRLGAQFALRDELGPAAQEALDALAHDLVSRFEAPETDPTRAPGTPGLFTDDGAPLGANPLAGLAGRIAVNPLADPAAGGAVWRLRDGLGAADPGPPGNSAGLRALAEALSRPAASPVAGPAGTSATARRFAERASELHSAFGAARHAAEQSRAFDAARADSLREMLLARGVDTDLELQHMLQIERAYAANARVLKAADEMLRRLMEI